MAQNLVSESTESTVVLSPFWDDSYNGWEGATLEVPDEDPLSAESVFTDCCPLERTQSAFLQVFVGVLSFGAVLSNAVLAGCGSATHRDRIAEYCTGQEFHEQRQFRDEFRTGIIYRSEANASHAHGESAGLRKDADDFINRIVLQAGFDVYSVAGSRKDADHGIEGSRGIYHFKDLALPPMKGEKKDSTIYKLVDVDYYLQKHQLLTDHPVIMYTLCPEQLSNEAKDHFYHFMPDGKTLFTKVVGGSEYQHEIWDYDHDTFASFSWYDWYNVGAFHLPYIWFSYRTHTCERRRLENGRYVVLLTPTAKHVGLKAVICRLFLGENTLTRMDVGSGELQVLSTYREGENLISMKFAGEKSEITLARNHWNALKAQNEINQGKLELGNITRKLEAIEQLRDKKRMLEAAPLIKRILDKMGGFDGKTYSVPVAVHYQPIYKDLVYDEGKPKGRLLGPGIVRGAVYAPVESLSSDIRTVAKRIEEPRKARGVPSWAWGYAKEFIDLYLAGERLVPVDYDEVYSRMARPTQRAKVDQLQHDLELSSTMSFDSFQKTEAYSNANDPRNITNPPTNHKLNWARFVYPMAEQTKRQHWYGFGLKPKELEQIVHQKASGCRHITLTDFSRLDGSLVTFFRSVERAKYLRAFGPSYYDEVSKVFDVMIGARGVTKMGVVYQVGSSRPSGVQDTADSNSGVTALYFYIVFRKMGYDPETAYRKLGIYAGDDGFNTDISTDLCKSVAVALGLDVKLEVVSEGAVTFLGRTYYNPWVNGHNTIDIMRCLRKLHFTSSPATVGNEIVLVRKALSLAFTDPQTPILGNWAKYILKKYGGSVKSVESDCVTDDFSNYYFMHGRGQEGEEKQTFTQPELFEHDNVVADYLERTAEIQKTELLRIDKYFADLCANPEQEGDIWPLLKEFTEPEVKPGTLYGGEVFGEITKAPIVREGNKVKFDHKKNTRKDREIVREGSDRLLKRTCKGTNCKRTVNGKHQFCATCNDRKKAKRGPKREKKDQTQQTSENRRAGK